jgi:(2R)-sulfolactate sulfo-lyase subunit alpha
MPHFLIHDKKDNVGVLIVDVKRGQEIVGVYLEGQGEVKVTALNDIPLGHKIALEYIREGEKAVKYGRPIGIAIKDIKIGEHVHVHNLKSLRWGSLSRR